MRNSFSLFTLFFGLFFLITFFRFFFPLLYFGIVFFAVNRLMNHMMQAQARKQAARFEKEKQTRIEREKERARHLSILDQIIFSINQILLSGRIDENDELFDDLIDCRTYLNHLKEIDYKGHKQILENINLALKNYIIFINKAIKTPEVDEVIKKVEASIPNIKYALKEMYLQTIKDDLLNMDVQIDVLNNQLKVDGLAPSDFDKDIA